jgi:hypothetical protein
MILQKLLSVLVVAAATAVPMAAYADDTSIESAIGALIEMRDETIGIMNYCYQNLGQDKAYIDARDTWYVRNGNDILLINAGLAKVGGVSADEQKSIDATVNDQVKKDVTGHTDPAGFCTLFADRMKNGTTQDLSVFNVSSPLIQRLRDWMKAQP